MGSGPELSDEAIQNCEVNRSRLSDYDTEETEDEVENFSDLLTQELGYTSTSTYPSAPTTIIDLPEITSAESEFFYNYYTRDERTVSTGVATIVDVNSGDQSVEFVKKQSRMPRSVIIKIKTPEKPAVNTESYLQSFATANGSSLMSEDTDKIVFEGAVANTRYSSIILQDNQVDETFYNQLTGSIAFTESYTKTDTNSEFVSNLNSMLTSPMAQATATPSTLKKTLSNFQPMGIAYAPSDSRVEDIAEALRDVRFVEFNFTANNAIISNLILAGLEDRGNIYQDELLSIVDDAAEVQSSYVASATPGLLDSSEFELELSPIHVITRADVELGSQKIDEESWPVGLYIEKTEMQTSSDGSITSKEMDPIIINSYSSFNILDSDIRYGATYMYSVKIIYMTAYEATAVDPDGLTEDEAVYAISLVASDGVKTQVAALENIPPNPPQNLRFNYNFSSNCLDIYWEEPMNPQRDVMRYQIFRRGSIKEPFVLLAELDFDNSTSRVSPLEKAPAAKLFRVSGPVKAFKDLTFERSGTYIYALAAVDARGLTSSYSEQVQVIFDNYKNKIITSRISPPSAPKPYPNLYLKSDLFVDNMGSSGASRMRIFFDPEYYDLLQSKTFIPSGEGSTPVKIQSSLGLIARKYKLQLINTDLQDSKIIDISIDDQTGHPMEIPMTDATIKSVF
jgi:hypothetical protein